MTRTKKTPTNPVTYWSIYASLVAALFAASGYMGILSAMWRTDRLYLTSVVCILYGIAEARIAIGYWRPGHQLTAVHDGEWLIDQMVLFGMGCTLLGILLTFWPFLTLGTNVEALRDHVTEVFAGVAVAFVPAVVSFALWFVLETNVQLLRWMNTRHGNQS